MDWSDRRDQLHRQKIRVTQEEKDLRFLTTRTIGALEKGSKMYPSLKKKMDAQKIRLEESRALLQDMVSRFEKDFPKIKR